ncbi:winged helix-turn-helix transcriptional regulator [Candidatus Pacearchaeota archaeon]|nr:winged helix-turn-helix transcriptional regulator [Candidatus Pacearchaeota archaeon]
MKQIIYYLIAGTKGGETRAKVIDAIKKKPQNAYRLAKKLKYDYKTVQHHLDILIDNGILEKKGAYGGVYFISHLMEENMAIFNEIWKKLGKNSGKSI